MDEEMRRAKGKKKKGREERTRWEKEVFIRSQTALNLSETFFSGKLRLLASGILIRPMAIHRQAQYSKVWTGIFRVLMQFSMYRVRDIGQWHTLDSRKRKQ